MPVGLSHRHSQVFMRKEVKEKGFYRRVLVIAVPILIHNAITNFVSLLDNIMVGQVGTTQMSGVSICNQLFLVFNLCIFGAISGAGIFTAQFYGSRDMEGVRHTFRYKLYSCLLLAFLGIGIFLLWGPQLISTYLQGEGSPEEARQILDYGLQYMKIMLLGLVPFALSQAYCGTLRECDKAVTPMVAGAAAVATNLILNYILIFGHLGFSPMGANGAAIATVISRYVELAVVVIWGHSHKREYPYLPGLYRSFRIPMALVKRITLKGMPLLLNEFLWSLGVATLAQCYSTCGLEVVPAQNITDTLNNLTNVAVLALGYTVGIIMGQMMGAGCTRKEIRSTNRKLKVVCVVSSLVFLLLQGLISPLFPRLYNTTESVRVLATRLILVSACVKPIMAYLNATYFTLRSGGKTWITLFYDGGFMWLVTIPLAYVLSRFTSLPIIPLYIICNFIDLIKVFVGMYMTKKDTWIQNLAK